MSETKFTSGKWEAEPQHDRVIAGNLVIAKVDGWTPEESDANVSLIAHAPDLYTALEDLMRELDTGWKNGTLPAVVTSSGTVQKAQRALAKARGEK